MEQTTRPHFDGLTIEWKGTKFNPWFGEHPEEAFREVGQCPLPEPSPEDEIVPVRGGFYFLGLPFLPEGAKGLRFKLEKVAQLVREDGVIAARKARHAKRFHPTQIPVELEAEIAARQAKGESTRKIAQWLTDDKGIDTTASSVGRAGTRYRLRQAREQSESLTRARLVEQQEQFDRVMDDIDRLRESAIADLLAGDQPDPAIESCFRMAHRQATLLQRDIREIGRHLTAEQRSAIREEPRQAPVDPPALADPPAPAKASGLAAGLVGLAAALFITFGSWPCSASPKAASSAPDRCREAVPASWKGSRSREADPFRIGAILELASPAVLATVDAP